MTTTNCTHEDNILYWEVIYQDATMRLVFVTCGDCHMVGAQVEEWDDDQQDYYFVSEVWHINNNKEDV